MQRSFLRLFLAGVVAGGVASAGCSKPSASARSEPSAATPGALAPAAAPSAVSPVSADGAADPGGAAAGVVAGRAWLDVTLPAGATPAAATGATATLVLALHDSPLAAADYAGVSLVVGAEAPRLIATGAKAELVVPASEPFRFEVGGAPVFANLRAGDVLVVREGKDGGWTARLRTRMPENAAANVTVCGQRNRACPAGYLSTAVYEGDPVCPWRADDEELHKCVKAPVVRGRGPLAGRVEIAEASASGRFDDLDAVSLAPRPLAANAFGGWVAVQIGGAALPRVRIGATEAFLVMAPGEAWQVWLDARGGIAAGLVTALK